MSAVCLFIILFSSIAPWWKNQIWLKNPIWRRILHFLKVCKLMRFWAEVEMCFHSCNHNLKSWLMRWGWGEICLLLGRSQSDVEKCQKGAGCEVRAVDCRQTERRASSEALWNGESDLNRLWMASESQVIFCSVKHVGANLRHWSFTKICVDVSKCALWSGGNQSDLKTFRICFTSHDGYSFNTTHFSR